MGSFVLRVVSDFQQKLVLTYTAEPTGTSPAKCFDQGHNTVVRPGFELTTFGLRVRHADLGF